MKRTLAVLVVGLLASVAQAQTEAAYPLQVTVYGSTVDGDNQRIIAKVGTELLQLDLPGTSLLPPGQYLARRIEDDAYGKNSPMVRETYALQPTKTVSVRPLHVTGRCRVGVRVCFGVSTDSE